MFLSTFCDFTLPRKLYVFLILCTFNFLLVWVMRINLEDLPALSQITSNIGHNESAENIMHFIRMSPTKNILVWPKGQAFPYDQFMQENVFVKNNCTYRNCFVTEDENYFGGDMFKFHAIGINGREFVNAKAIPAFPRWPHQKYIYYNTESSANIPIPRRINVKGYYNWTSTYRLDSDIPFPYILIKDNLGNIVGPKVDMKWKENMIDVDDETARRLVSKTKVAVAFISNCHSRSGREKVINKLKSKLINRGYDLDVYGSCGDLECSREHEDICDNLVDQYYFYLSFENSLCIDYVTEKLLRPLHHNTVPVVLGGANYSRFLPPGSYLNVEDFASYDALADTMIDLMHDPDRYRLFFGWKKHYTYHDATPQNVCELCAALNDQQKYETQTIYQDIMLHWNGYNDDLRIILSLSLLLLGPVCFVLIIRYILRKEVKYRPIVRNR